MNRTGCLCMFSSCVSCLTRHGTQISESNSIIGLQRVKNVNFLTLFKTGITVLPNHSLRGANVTLSLRHIQCFAKMRKAWELINEFQKLKHQFEEHNLFYLATQHSVIFHVKMKVTTVFIIVFQIQLILCNIRILCAAIASGFFPMTLQFSILIY